MNERFAPILFSKRWLPRCFAFAALTTAMLSCSAQPRPAFVELTEADEPGCSFADKADMAIQNARSLDVFFEKMRLQRTRADRKVTIVQIGDSHVLGNFMTRVVREKLQREFGNAGRGLIFPYRLAGTNGPTDFEMTGKGGWSSNDLNTLKENVAIGVSGFSISTTNPQAELSLRLRTDSSAIERFTKITVFHPNDERSFDFEISDAERPDAPKAMPVIDGARFTAYYLDRPTGEAVVKNVRSSASQKTVRIDGISIENELSGVVYHSIGVNGARFWHYSNATDFAQQIGDLAPDLIILSCGTNEAQDETLTHSALKKQIEALVKALKESCGSPAFLLTTPADSYLRGKGFNPHMAEVRQAIVDFAAENDLAFWDLYGLTGGKNSAQRWKEQGLMSRDSVHYSREGYSMQGKLLYWSLIKSYNDLAVSKP